MTFQSGFPAPVTSNIDTTGTGISSRPDLVPGQTRRSAGRPAHMEALVQYRRFRAGAVRPLRNFAPHRCGPPAGHHERGFLDQQVAADSRKRKSLEFRSEFFNLLKNYNPDPATVDLNSRSATFGMVGGGVQGITTRVIQLGAKLVF